MEMSTLGENLVNRSTKVEEEISNNDQSAWSSTMSHAARL
jgi:hypothetical protein